MKKIRRIYLASDILHRDELNRSRETLADILDCEKILYPKLVFDKLIDYAWHKPEEVWKEILISDEIYGDTSLVPLSGFGSYTGSPVLMDAMMKKAVEEKITGKKVFFFRNFNEIEWSQIDIDLLKKAFQKNDLYTMEYNQESYEFSFQKVNINEIKKDNYA